MFHVSAWGVPYIAAAMGCKLVLPGPGLDGESLVRLIDGEQVSLALGVPTIWMGLLAALDKTGSKVPSLKRTVVGGAALPPSMIDEFRDKYGTELIHAWGMTETSPLGTLNHLLQKHMELPAAEQIQLRQCQGRPPWGVELRLLGLDGQVLPHDGHSQGTLQIRGHWIIDTYFGMEYSALTEDGWFDTGDIASIDPDGYLTIRDRSKDIIKSGGEWISTVELENIAIAHPGISNAAAIAAEHKQWGERPVVVAVKAPGADPSEQEVLDFYTDRIVKWQIPDRVVFIETLPLGATGKVLKNKLREMFGKVGGGG
ncbi:MAG: AMP-binding protein [Thiolinea sp.]